MAKIRKKRNIKTAFVAVLAILLALGSVVSFVALGNRNKQEIGAGEFSIGALDPATGKYVNRKDAIYTPEAFSAQGLSIAMDFETQDVTYQIFFYDENDRFLESTDVLSENYVEERLLPTYARVVIYPSTLDEEGNRIEDYEVSRFGVRKLAKALTIEVDADQTKVYSNNLFEAGENGISERIELDGFDGLLLHLPSAAVTETKYVVTFYAEKTDAEGTATMRELDDVTIALQNYAAGEFMWYSIDQLPYGATHATITYFDGNTNVGVYGID